MAKGGSDALSIERRVTKSWVEYREGPWGLAVRSKEGASALWDRAPLVFLALLERHGIEGASLVRLSAPRSCFSIFDPGDVHFVVKVSDEYFDVTARRFEPSGPIHNRRGLGLLRLFWDKVEEAGADPRDPTTPGGPVEGAPENWRELADVEPPGDAIGWSYPDRWPVEAVAGAG